MSAAETSASFEMPLAFTWPDGTEECTAVAAFCGAGGSTKGLEDAGYRTLGFDYWPPAVDTHNANGMPAKLHDLSNGHHDDAIPSCGLMWLSPPCQPFSAAGEGEGEFDDRDGLPWALRIIAKRLPAVVIIENVKGLTFSKHHAYFAGILASLRELGYEVDWRVLNSADYGVPQTRERCFIICRRDGGRIVWPTPTHTEHAGMFTDKWVAMADALGWDTRSDDELIAPSGERPERVFADQPAPPWHWSRRRTPRVVINYRQTNRNGGPIYCNATNRPAPTIGTQSRSQWIVNGTQKLTAEETALLQGFPADYVWTGNMGDVDRQIGNAVPPAVARALSAANVPDRNFARAAAPCDCDSHTGVGEDLWKCDTCGEVIRYVDDPEGKVTLTELHPYRNRRVRVEMVTPGERPGNRGWWS